MLNDEFRFSRVSRARRWPRRTLLVGAPPGLAIICDSEDVLRSQLPCVCHTSARLSNALGSQKQ